MFRIFSTIAILALTITTAQADPSSTRIHDAAVAACASESVSGGQPVSHYGAITARCIERVSNAATARYEAEAQAKARNKLAGN